MNGENNSSKNFSFIKSYTLIQQTPLIHFQHSQDGATLRATEVKPKLDRFLREKVGDEKLKEWFIKDTGALNYKLRFKREGESVFYDLGRNTDYEIFYGNMGTEGNKGNDKPNGNRNQGRQFYDGRGAGNYNDRNNLGITGSSSQEADKYRGVSSVVKMTVVCTITELADIIDEYVCEFFAVSAFGTMSGKGFGCFSVMKEKPMDPSEIAAALKQNYGARYCYVFSGGKKPFKQIKTLYSLMKSGINFNGYQRSLLFLYMHEKCGIDNEKAWMKQTGIMPIVNNSGKYVKEEIGTKPRSRYVRALLGTSDGYKVMDENRHKLSLEIEGGEIERCPSPILFRIFDGNVYMVANRIPTKIYGKTFGFKCKREGKISVPELSEIGGDSFIDDFLEYAVKRITTEENIKQFFGFQITIREL